jgi:hypothetical protein
MQSALNRLSSVRSTCCRPAQRLTMSSSAEAGAKTATRVQLPIVPLTAEAFEPFGQVWAICGESGVGRRRQLALTARMGCNPQVVSPQDDGKLFDHTDAQLVLDKGTPR